jgi:hypothetical protein
MYKLASLATALALTLAGTALAGPHASRPGPPSGHRVSTHTSHKPISSSTTTYKKITTTSAGPAKFTTVKASTFSTPHTTVAYKKTTIGGSKVVSTTRVWLKNPNRLVVGPAGRPRVALARYAATYGVKFRYGFYYRGPRHLHWGLRYFSPVWRTWLFFDPCTSVWYYWCGPRVCYLPVTCITLAAPTVMVDSGVPTDLPSELQDLPEASAGEQPDLPVPQ